MSWVSSVVAPGLKPIHSNGTEWWRAVAISHRVIDIDADEVCQVWEMNDGRGITFDTLVFIRSVLRTT